MAESHKLPTLFIPHGGGPCFFMDWNPPETWKKMGSWLEGLGASLGTKPKAVIVVSAHWEEPEFTVTGNPAPDLIYDYHGFPPHTYQLTYPAPGAPGLAKKVVAALTDAGITARLDAERGYDHGVFIPFKLIYPGADIPVIQLSLKEGLDPAAHLAAGRALESLRKEGVLIVGSGMSYHNLRKFFGGDHSGDAQKFDGWLTAAATAQPATREKQLNDWEQAPAARHCHPREEHLLPLMVVAGAAGADAGKQIFRDDIMGIALSAYQFGEA